VHPEKILADAAIKNHMYNISKMITPPRKISKDPKRRCITPDANETVERERLPPKLRVYLESAKHCNEVVATDDVDLRCKLWCSGCNYY